ncbi:hypothetical protein AOQ84DRAFT_112540 [Glonium stellatum]|uniref:F-box domain-containing protein n=1 Tax=Glonium stellatum TaxID=574774 RepID=A0A8E2FAD3_9PEZI|nr:hypothetical protein AOQ84DRAFT_112540 [Glonium stellatum]
MAASDIVEAFKRLSPSRSRAAVLDGIIAELTPYEWRDALKKLQKRPFLFDIVASLPAEIIIHIFSYLDVLTPFRLQRVRKPCHISPVQDPITIVSLSARLLL